MLKDIIIIDNVFDDPDSILEFAKQQTFYRSANHPVDSTKGVRWKGTRSNTLANISKLYFNKTMNEVISKMLEKTFQSVGPISLSWTFDGSAVFHSLTDSIEEGIHVDHDCLYSGVVYLSKDAPFDSGTVLYDGNQKVIANIPNEYNKLVLHNSRINHNAVNGFGDSIETSRLTLNIFFKSLSFKVLQ